MSDDLRISSSQIIERYLSMELVRVTERAAVSAARLRGHGNEKAADQAAVDAMRRELNRLPIDGEIVIGEGERDEAPMLFIGERVGTRQGPKVHIAVDPLEGTTLCAKDMPDSIAVMAMAEAGKLLNDDEVKTRALHNTEQNGIVQIEGARPDLPRMAGVPTETDTVIAAIERGSPQAVTTAGPPLADELRSALSTEDLAKMSFFAFGPSSAR